MAQLRRLGDHPSAPGNAATSSLAGVVARDSAGDRTRSTCFAGFGDADVGH